MNGSMSKEKIQQLLKAVGSRPQTDDSSIEFVEYNWHEPHYFSKEQLTRLEAFVQKVAEVLSERFIVLCRSRFEVQVTSTSQHYAGEMSATSEEDEKKSYYLSFGSTPGKEFGLLEIPDDTAVFLAKQLLGDSDGNEDSKKELSQLEESLLYDLTSALIKTLSSAHAKCEYIPSGNIVSGRLPINFNEAQEICRISLSVKKGGSEVGMNASFLIPCNKLEIVTGKNKHFQDESSVQDYSKVIIEHLGLTPVSITVQLAKTELSFEEMMNLQVDDIIVLDKQIEEPLELIVEGQYAVSIEATDF
jgi:flagellar motor switch protein FliM